MDENFEVKVTRIDKRTGWPARAMIYVYINPNKETDIRGEFDNAGELIPPPLFARITTAIYALNDVNLKKLGVIESKKEEFKAIRERIIKAHQELQKFVGLGPQAIEEGRP